jgi:hypothetical protein
MPFSSTGGLSFRLPLMSAQRWTSSPGTARTAAMPRRPFRAREFAESARRIAGVASKAKWNAGIYVFGHKIDQLVMA